MLIKIHKFLWTIQGAHFFFNLRWLNLLLFFSLSHEYCPLFNENRPLIKTACIGNSESKCKKYLNICTHDELSHYEMLLTLLCFPEQSLDVFLKSNNKICIVDFVDNLENGKSLHKFHPSPWKTSYWINRRYHMELALPITFIWKVKLLKYIFEMAGFQSCILGKWHHWKCRFPTP